MISDTMSVFMQHGLHEARMLSGSKSNYRLSHPNNEALLAMKDMGLKIKLD